MLQEKQSITNQEIQNEFGVSYDSAKRDLRILEEKGLLKRTHGGAIPTRQIGSQYQIGDLTAKERCENVMPNYLAIAKRALQMIEKNDVIFLTSASIGYLMANHFPKELACTVVTNSITIAETLRAKENVNTVLLGGEMKKNGCIYDGFAIEMLQRIRFDKAFLTSACVSAEFGLSIQRSRNLAIYDEIIQGSKKVIGLYPTGKIGMNSVISICPVNKLDVLITDDDASEEDLTAIEELDVHIVIAE